MATAADTAARPNKPEIESFVVAASRLPVGAFSPYTPNAPTMNINIIHRDVFSFAISMSISYFLAQSSISADEPRQTHQSGLALTSLQVEYLPHLQP
jgi:hypothetical protein